MRLMPEKVWRNGGNLSMLEILKQSNNPEICKPLVGAVIEKAKDFQQKFGLKPAFMEVCGSHTMALARTGVKQCFKDDVNLIFGPGCPRVGYRSTFD
jgi:hydrogenase expression/formation protein HypD